MKKIKLTQNKFALVDDVDFEWLNQWKWYAYKSRETWYAARRKNISMHRLILGLENGDGKITDHINHNGLNNQRYNIRIVTHSENASNRKNVPKGVYWDKRNKNWRTEISINCKRIYLGQFKTEKEAADAYARAKSK